VSTLVSLKPKLGWVSSELFDDRMDSSFYLSQIELGLDKIFNKKDIKLLTLEDITRRIVDGPFGSAVLANDYVSEGIPFLRVQNVTDYGLNLDDVIFISKECNERIARSQAVKGNIVFTKTGWLGNTCVLTSEYDVYNIRGDLAVLECKDDVDPYYISTYLNSSFGKKVTSSFGSGSTRPRILLSNIRKIPVPIPSGKIQSYIGNKVRKAEELREEAKRLKKEVDNLIYSILKIEEFNQKNNGQSRNNWVRVEQLENRLDATYYKEIYLKVFSHLKELGYPLVKIKKIGQINKGTSYDEKYSLKSSKEYSFVRISDIGELEINYNEVVNISFDAFQSLKKYHINQGDILFAITGATIGKVCINHLGKPSVTSGDIGYLRVNHPEVSPYYVLMYFKTIFGQLQLEQGITGATNRHLAVNFIEDIEIPLIPKEIQETIENNIVKAINNTYLSKKLIVEAKQDVEDLIEGKFDESKISEGV